YGSADRPAEGDYPIPRDLARVIHTAIAPELEHRYKSAGDLATDLARFLESKRVRGRRVNPFGRFWFWTRRHPGLAVGLGSVVLPGVGFVKGWMHYFAQRGRKDPAQTRRTHRASRAVRGGGG